MAAESFEKVLPPYRAKSYYGVNSIFKCF